MLTVPNALTLLRLFAVPVFLYASFRGDYRLAFFIFVAAALTDFLDGMIARRFNQRSRLGAILDPAADKIMMTAGYLFYTLRKDLPFGIPAWLTFTVFIRDFMIIMVAYLLYTRTHVKRFPPSWAGKTSTALQAVTLGTVIEVNAFGPALLPLLLVLFRVVLLATLFSSWDYLRKGKGMIAAAHP
jgi:Phosphatidylglycerophosphate synthase